MSSLRTVRRVVVFALVALLWAATGPVATAAPLPPTLPCDNEASGSGDDYPGPQASARYDRLFSRSHPVPHLRTRIPQGMATWSNWKGDQDLLLITSYAPGAGDEPFHPTEHAYVIALDARTGRHVGTAETSPSHVGGIAVFEEQGWAFVSDAEGGKVRRFPLDRLREAITRSEFVQDTAPKQEVAASSFLTSHGPTDTLWAGRFDADAPASMSSYVVARDGTLTPGFSTVEVPPGTQGVVVTEDAFVFSSSYGRNNTSTVTVLDRGGGDASCFAAPSMAEAPAVYGDDVYLVYESGASHYADAADAPDNVVAHLHRAPLRSLTG
jgi:hypothetical protein